MSADLDASIMSAYILPSDKVRFPTHPSRIVWLPSRATTGSGLQSIGGCRV